MAGVHGEVQADSYPVPLEEEEDGEEMQGVWRDGEEEDGERIQAQMDREQQEGTQGRRKLAVAAEGERTREGVRWDDEGQETSFRDAGDSSREGEGAKGEEPGSWERCDAKVVSGRHDRGEGEGEEGERRFLSSRKLRERSDKQLRKVHTSLSACIVEQKG